MMGGCAPTITVFKGNLLPNGGKLPLNIFVKELKRNYDK
jgi:hypothetical protein